jgi:uroporphyrinogen decarboxylase
VSRLRNDRLLRALRRQSLDVTPVWLMRQAGRYLPEYRAIRARAGSFMTLCKTPELACEVALQPLARFPLDAAILFSDILTVPDAMGLRLTVEDGLGPRLERPVRAAADVARLGRPDPEADLGYVMQALRLIRRELDGRVPLIGFAGSPWTLATYMVEGQSSRDFHKVKRLLYEQPALAHDLLARVTLAVTDYLNAQIAAGAQVLMIFDSWGGVLTTRDYLEYSLRYIGQILEALSADPGGEHVPTIVFTKGGGQWLEAIAACGCDAVGLDWTCDIGDARRRIGEAVALQGNLDPALLPGEAGRVVEEVETILAAFGPGPGHVFNLGHGVTPDAEPDTVLAMVEAVHDRSRRYHAGG